MKNERQLNTIAINLNYIALRLNAYANGLVILEGESLDSINLSLYDIQRRLSGIVNKGKT